MLKKKDVEANLLSAEQQLNDATEHSVKMFWLGNMSAWNQIYNIYNDEEERNSEALASCLEVTNEILGTRFVKAKGLASRIKEGATEEDVATVVEAKKRDWEGTEMEKYLRPETLFSSKFWGYLRAAKKENTAVVSVPDPDGKTDGADRYFDINKVP